MSGVPLLVEAAGLRVLIVGGGTVAARKASALSAAGASVRVVAPRIGEEVRRLADAGSVSVTERAYASGDVGDADLVIAATDHRATNAAVTVDARALHRLVNVADAPADGSFSTMATHRSGALVVGVSAGVPAAAARIRDAIAARFGAAYGEALEVLSQRRDELLAAGQGARWRSLSAEVIGGEFCDAVDGGTLHERLATWR